MPDPSDRLQKLTSEIRLEFPDFKVLFKDDSRLMRAIDILLRVVTLNQMSSFLTAFVTTIGYTVYVSRKWWGGPDIYNKLIVLRHERVHMRQRRKYGMILYSLLYVILPLPGFLAYWRMKFEREAYEETIRAMAEYCEEPDDVASPARKEAMISYFTGPSYFFMWPFRKSTEAWFDKAVAAAVKSEVSRRALKRPSLP